MINIHGATTTLTQLGNNEEAVMGLEHVQCCAHAVDHSYTATDCTTQNAQQDTKQQQH